MLYAEQLKDRRWQIKKNQILQRDGFKCQCSSCENQNSNATLEVHHLFYIQGLMAWVYSDDCLITLCDVCHDREKGRKKIETDFATALEVKCFLYADIKCFTTMLYADQKFTDGLLNYLRRVQNG